MRACFALAGAGSLGTFVSAAVREVLLAVDAHNQALEEGLETGPRLLHPRWGHITVDAVGGASAGALCGTQIVRALLDREYLGSGLPLDALGTFTGDWVAGGDFARYAIDDARALTAGPVAAPGWTLLNGTRLFQRTRSILTESHGMRKGPSEPHSALDAGGVIGLAITLTDMFGFHEPAEFDPEHVQGHPSFGRSRPSEPRYFRGRYAEVRDLGVRNHAEVRRLFIARDEDGVAPVAAALKASRRGGRARALGWCPETIETLAALAAASASLPFAFGPIALRDRAVDLQEVCTRIYMDGGTLNNRPISPTLNLGRWSDDIRMLRCRQPDGSFRREDVLTELGCERVCFFVDAFPDPVADEWLSPHPDRDGEEHYATLDAGAREYRERRIREALERPGAGLDLFLESLLASLRAQDIRDIAKVNFRLSERRRFIVERCTSPPPPRPDFAIDSLSHAHALAAVLSVPCGRELPHDVALAVAERIWESDRLSGLSGRQEVTMVPIFSPRNRDGALAGEGLYTLGGLLSYDSRMHDARVGSLVARHVLAGLRQPDEALSEVSVPDARKEVVPEDASQVVDRLRVFTRTALEGVAPEGSIMRWISGLSLVTEPLFRRVGARLDDLVRGAPEPPPIASGAPLPGDGGPGSEQGLPPSSAVADGPQSPEGQD